MFPHNAAKREHVQDRLKCNGPRTDPCKIPEQTSCSIFIKFTTTNRNRKYYYSMKCSIQIIIQIIDPNVIDNSE